jgi:hypothetical protein
MGVSMESMLTLQYLAFKASISTLSKFVVEVDLTQFLEKCNEALPYFELFSHNESLTNLEDPLNHTSYLVDIFTMVASDYQYTDDLQSSLESYSTEIEEISSTLLIIADIWLAAGNILMAEIAGQVENDAMFIVLIGGITLVALISIVGYHKKLRIDSNT